MTDDDLLSSLKSTLLIPNEVNTFDQILMAYLLGAKSYINSILDRIPEDDELYNLTLIYLAQYYYLNRDNPKLKNLPVTLNSLLNRLKTKYHD